MKVTDKLRSVAYLVMTPRQHNLVEPAMSLIDSILGGEDIISYIRVLCESIRVNDLVGEFASYNCGKTRDNLSLNKVEIRRRSYQRYPVNNQ